MASNNSKPNLSTAVSQQVNSSQSNNTPKEKPAIPKSNKIKHDKSSSSSSGHYPMSSSSINSVSNNSNSQTMTRSKKPSSSFQITSVSVNTAGSVLQQPQQHQQQQPRINSSDNNGDDSADDLDESHTDDSRITDYETPSISEDTFSREDVFFTQSTAFSTAPVIPTSSQYGLAIVGPDLGANGQNLSDVHVSVSDAGMNIIGQLPNKQEVDIHHKNERFKVVKIESTEPFKRGRWMCMDYLDHTTLQAQDDGIDGNIIVMTKDSGIEILTTDGYATDTQKSTLNDSDERIIEPTHHDGQDHYQEMTQNEPQNAFNHLPSHAQTMTFIHIQHENSAANSLSGQSQSMPQAQFEEIISQANEPSQNSRENNANHLMSNESSTVPLAASQPFLETSNLINDVPLSLMESVQDNSASTNYRQHSQSLTADVLQHSMQQQTHEDSRQGITLPTNTFLHNLGIDNSKETAQLLVTNPNDSSNAPPLVLQSVSSPNSSNIENSTIGSIIHKNDSANVDQSNLLTSQSQNHRIGTGDDKRPQKQQQQSIDSEPEQSGNTMVNSKNLNNFNSDENAQNIASPSSAVGPVISTDGIMGGPSESIESALNNSNNGNTTGNAIGEDGQSLNEDNESHLNFNQGKGLRLLPHQHVKYSKGLPSGIIHRGMGGFFTNLLAGSSFGNINPTKIICNQSEETKSDISKSNKNLLKFSPTMATKTTTAANTCIGCSPDGLKTTAISMNLSLGSICSNAGCVGASYKDKDGSSSNRASRSASPALGNPTEINSASGTSAVAIDNKIEQAMDLVKSHLMFAVREEVEVLKEKIAELMDRINQLEVENTILRANASQETLSQISASLAVSSASSQPPSTHQNLSPVIAAPLQQIANQSLNQSGQPVATINSLASQSTQNQPASS